MANHYISVDRGDQCFVYSDFVHGTASRPEADIELRIKDGAGWTRKEVVAVLNAFERFIGTVQWVDSAGLDVKT